MARYTVIHETCYHYGSAVSLSQQQLHLAPRICSWQQCLRQELQVDPVPTLRHDSLDAFGNSVSWLSFHAPHDHLHVRAEMDIEVLPSAPRTLASIAWDELRERLRYHGQAPQPDDLAAQRFLFESSHVRVKHEFVEFARACFVPGQPLLVCTQRLMSKIFEEFEFDPEATTVATPVLEVLDNRRGVCQDFAHLMLACLRSMGLPARYMSGYLLTQPPPGKPRLIGADASHAWISVYCPGVGDGWVDFDPTNNLLPDLEHITLAWGRDFVDVSPMRGVILGGGGHEPDVEVTVIPFGETAVPRPGKVELASAGPDAV
jgi:transglutaminase-like putative cysteine protease